MDSSIRFAALGDHFNNGVAAYDLGRNVTDHDLAPGSPEAKDHEFGWHSRRIECERALAAKQSLQLIRARLTEQGQRMAGAQP